VSNGPIPGEDEDMHCLVSGDYEDDVKKAVMRKDLSFFLGNHMNIFSSSSFLIEIEEVLTLAKTQPENPNKMNQLRELAALNG